MSRRRRAVRFAMKSAVGCVRPLPCARSRSKWRPAFGGRPRKIVGGRNPLLLRHCRNGQLRVTADQWRALLVAHVLQRLGGAPKSGSTLHGNASGDDHMSKRIIALATLFLALCTTSFSAGAGPQFTVALQGYDAVSYFDGTTPQKGDFMHAVHWN